MMTALIDQHNAAASMLTKNWNKQERLIPVDLSVSSSKGGLQLSIDVGIEKEETRDMQKPNNALLEMDIADFLLWELTW